ncbi:uncharacterized protein LOC144102482 isoform X1 [Amblyomma americanum]
MPPIAVQAPQRRSFGVPVSCTRLRLQAAEDHFLSRHHATALATEIVCTPLATVSQAEPTSCPSFARRKRSPIPAPPRQVGPPAAAAAASRRRGALLDGRGAFRPWIDRGSHRAAGRAHGLRGFGSGDLLHTPLGRLYSVTHTDSFQAAGISIGLLCFDGVIDHL